MYDTRRFDNTQDLWQVEYENWQIVSIYYDQSWKYTTNRNTKLKQKRIGILVYFFWLFMFILFKSHSPNSRGIYR